MNDVSDPNAETDSPKKKTRVFTEEAKQRHVTHWDWDYLPREELDRRLMEDAESAGEQQG